VVRAPRGPLAGHGHAVPASRGPPPKPAAPPRIRCPRHRAGRLPRGCVGGCATLPFMVRPDERSLDRSRYTEPAGASPARTGVGPSGSRPAARGEIVVAEAGCRKPLRREQERGPQHHVKPAASTQIQCGSRAEHVAAKATFAVRKSEDTPAASPAGVWGAARAQGSVWNRRGPSARPTSGQSGAYKPKVKSRRVQRESEGIVVPAMAATNNAAGGKDPCFGHARREGKCKGMDGKTVPNYPHVREHAAETRQPRRGLWTGAKRQPGRSAQRTTRLRGDAHNRRDPYPAAGAAHAPSRRPSVSRVLEIGTHGLNGGLTASRLFSGVT
jgi:hypothetical protein